MPVETIEDHRVKFKPTAQLIDFILKNLKSAKNVPDNINVLKKCHPNERKKCFIYLEDIKWIKSCMDKQQNGSDNVVYVHELLEKAVLQLPEPKVTPRNPVLEARIKKLQAQQDNRDYNAMTKSVDSTRKHLPEDTLSYQMKVMNQQLIAVAQFVFSVIAGFAFGFVGIEYLVNNLDFGFRLLLGIMCALIIALSEIYFLAKKLSEDYDEVPKGTVKKLHQE
ncbi:unnamed protein product [Trichogramma brassicae]|uniref:Biogenesis of lysosome-related organelles complex 1 subunit 5 n=1 Tax=Trichogramma brassicae TaxID=86971 RepID=A0A6H5IUL2_9HYME|nr:unnamed protein product [Trichogramma brassicae]